MWVARQDTDDYSLWVIRSTKLVNVNTYTQYIRIEDERKLIAATLLRILLHTDCLALLDPAFKGRDFKNNLYQPACWKSHLCSSCNSCKTTLDMTYASSALSSLPRTSSSCTPAQGQRVAFHTRHQIPGLPELVWRYKITYNCFPRKSCSKKSSGLVTCN